MKVILNNQQLQESIKQLVQQLKAKYKDLNNVVFVGIQQGGVVLGDEIVSLLAGSSSMIQYGQLDITFYRDDIRKELLMPDKMNIPFPIENRNVVLIDDVLFTGRTIKAALDVLLDYGRPAKVELCVLIDRKEHRQFPIQADYVGKTLETAKQDKIKLLKNDKGEKQVVLISG